MKKYLIFGAMFLVLGLGAVAVLAESTNSGTGSVNSSAVAGPMMINIGPAGNVLLRGTIESVGADSLVVKSWGGSWTIQISPTTQIISLNKALTDFQVDGIVGVLGTISTDGEFVIDARIARAWGHRPDSDTDGIPDNQDTDDDNDGVDNSHDLKIRDHDDDGISDALDTDDDNDGILDVNESNKGHDHDNDGISDSRDDDDDNDDIEDAEDLEDNDHDNDGVSDKDDDNDDDSADDNSGSGSGN